MGEGLASCLKILGLSQFAELLQAYLPVHAQSCLTLCDPMDCSLPGSSICGILQARIVEWVAMSSSRDLPDPGIKPMSPVSPALQANSLLAEPSGKTITNYLHNKPP